MVYFFDTNIIVWISAAGVVNGMLWECSILFTTSSASIHFCMIQQPITFCGLNKQTDLATSGLDTSQTLTR